MKNYKHFISLGYFCSVALELESMGFRDTSSPFDWCTNGLEGVLKAIEDNFADLLNPQYLYQRKSASELYKNIKYDITFFHDFDGFVPLEQQLPAVKEKYSRRISRFYKNISEPTLFVRYINNNGEYGRPDELIWIEENYDYIQKLIKSFNPENDIIFIASKGYAFSEKVDIFYVEPDKGEKVARTFAKTDDKVKAFFDSMDYPQKAENLNVYQKNQLAKKVKKQFNRHLTNTKKKIRKPYIHPQQYK